EVVNAFAERVGSQRRLDHLYVLTVADIAATSPRLWNSWKDSLLWTLYKAAAAALARGLEHPFDRRTSLYRTRASALAALRARGYATQQVERCWRHLPERAFLRLDAEQLLWATAEVLAADELPLVGARRLEDKGISECFVQAEDFDGLFAVVARELDRMELDVLAARVITTADGKSWDIFQIMDANSQPLHDSDVGRLKRLLVAQLAARDVRPLPARPVPRRLQP